MTLADRIALVVSDLAICPPGERPALEMMLSGLLLKVRRLERAMDEITADAMEDEQTRAALVGVDREFARVVDTWGGSRA